MRTLSVLVVPALGTLLLASAAQGAAYTITDLGVLGGGNFSVAYGVNATGQVTGDGNITGGSTHAFLYDGTLHDIGTLGGTVSVGQAVNNSGKVTGFSTTSAGATHAFFYDDTMHDMGTLSGGTVSAGNGINSDGLVTGYSNNSGGLNRAFAASYNSSSGSWNMTDLGTLGGRNSKGLAINAAGAITGYAEINATFGSDHAFIATYNKTSATWSMTDLGALNGPSGMSHGQAISDAGQVAGYSTTASGPNHAFIASHNNSTGTWGMTDLGTLGGAGVGNGINSSGQVVGYSYTSPSGGAQHAFLYDGTMKDLNTLIPTGSGWTLTQATAINDAGQITGQGTIGGQTHAFLLTPVPEPTALTLLFASTATLTLRRRRT